MRFPRFSLLALSLALVASPALLWADIVTLNGGRLMKGIVDEERSTPEKIRFTGATGALSIPRQRIESIEKEPISRGYVHIGDEFTSRGSLSDALAQYRKADELEPGVGLIEDRIKTTEASIDEELRLKRQDELLEVEDLAGAVVALIEAQEFEKAEVLLERASLLKPGEHQVENLQQLVGGLYLAWAKYHLDHLDSSSAEKMLDLALAAEPASDEIYALLLTIWENQPEKQSQLLTIYKTILEKRPEDDVLRRKVADMFYARAEFEESMRHYLLLYRKMNRQSGTMLEARVAENLERLHQRAAANENWKEAIDYVSLLSEIDPDVDLRIVTNYQYFDRASQLAEDDVDGWLGLGAWAEENDMAIVALDIYRGILLENEDNEAAAQALSRFAMALVGQAEGGFDRGEYLDAITYANQVLRDFPEMEEAALRARQIRGMAETELIRERRDRRAQAMAYIEKGDVYFERANRYYGTLFSKETRTDQVIAPPKTEAKRLYRSAIDAYEAAIDLDPSLLEEGASLVGPNLEEAKRRLRLLERSAPAVGVEGFRRPRGG